MENYDEKTKENIERLIREHGDADYDSLISEKGYYHFYNLSSLRHALLDWYPFERGTALEVGPGYGGMTGLYLKKIGRVDVAERDRRKCESLRHRFCDRNIGIYQTDVFGINPEKKYDYVFIVDDPSLYSEGTEKILAAARRCLKNNGTVVIGFRNRNGIKYSCGSLDEYVRKPFDTSRLIAKKEFDAAAVRLFRSVRYYYPFPDHIYTQAVFSDICLPNENLRDRVLPMDPFDSPLLKNEIEEYGKAVKYGQIADRCNFCLAFLSDRQQNDPSVVQAFLSYDRGERSMITAFYSNGSVKKSAVREKGKEFLKQSFFNLEELRSRGITVVDQILDGDTICMPWIKAKGLLRKIEELTAARDREGLINVFRNVREAVIMSSVIDDSGYDSEKWGIPVESAGEILQKGYTELIPLNAFDTNSGILFYDQEFSEDYCPVIYPVYRAILYAYMSIPEMEKVILKRDMYDVFGIDPARERALSIVENRFIEKTRNLGLYRQMYGWANKNKESAEKWEPEKIG